MKHLKVDGLDIAYFDEGKGTAVLLGHCSSASHKEWAPLIEDLRNTNRVLAPDFVGYGQTDAWPAEKPFSIDTDVSVLTGIAKKTRGPLHLVGHSYGAALALEAARTLGHRVKSLTLIEPVSFHLLRLERRPEWAEIETLGLAVLGAVARGDDREAARAFMSYWLGRFRWWIAPERFRQAITTTIPKVALEFSIAIDAQTSLSDYAKITTPTALIVGSKTRKPARAVVDLLGEAMPNAKIEILRGAGHMSPFTHPAEVNQLILDHLAAQR